MALLSFLLFCHGVEIRGTLREPIMLTLTLSQCQNLTSSRRMKGRLLRLPCLCCLCCLSVCPVVFLPRRQKSKNVGKAARCLVCGQTRPRSACPQSVWLKPASQHLRASGDVSWDAILANDNARVPGCVEQRTLHDASKLFSKYFVALPFS